MKFKNAVCKAVQASTCLLVRQMYVGVIKMTSRHGQVFSRCVLLSGEYTHPFILECATYFMYVYFILGRNITNSALIPAFIMMIMMHYMNIESCVKEQLFS